MTLRSGSRVIVSYTAEELAELLRESVVDEVKGTLDKWEYLVDGSVTISGDSGVILSVEIEVEVEVDQWAKRRDERRSA